MKIAVLKERCKSENRVAISPETVKKLVTLGFSVCIEKDAGEKSSFTNEQYLESGAKISSILLEIIADADIILKVQPSPCSDNNEELSELDLMREGAVIIGLLAPYNNKNLIKQYSEKKITSFAMDFIPRITRAQTMDALSSQANLAGYKAVMEAASEYQKIFAMMMTAAGTLSPAKVLVLGAGVAGLQAIATAKRLGAIVSAFDVRKAAKEQVQSLGAKFIEVTEADEQSLETTLGYAKEASLEYKNKQKILLNETLKKHDIVICTALIPSKQAPILIDKNMVSNMKAGSIIVDIATASGGNCELSIKDEVLDYQGIKIIGYSNMPSRIASDASKLYANNLLSFLKLLYDQDSQKIVINMDDEIIKNTLITFNGEVKNSAIKGVINE